MAPIAQTNDIPSSDFISIYCEELVSVTQKGKLINSSNDIYIIISKSNHPPTNKKPNECGANYFQTYYLLLILRIIVK